MGGNFTRFNKAELNPRFLCDCFECHLDLGATRGHTLTHTHTHTVAFLCSEPQPLCDDAVFSKPDILLHRDRFVCIELTIIHLRELATFCGCGINEKRHLYLSQQECACVCLRVLYIYSMGVFACVCVCLCVSVCVGVCLWGASEWACGGAEVDSRLRAN